MPARSDRTAQLGLGVSAYSFKANLNALQTADHMLGALLDAFA